MGRGPPKRVFTARSRFYRLGRFSRLVALVLAGTTGAFLSATWLLHALTEPAPLGAELSAALWNSRVTTASTGLRVRVELETSAIFAETSQRFLCWTIDMTDDREFFDVNFRDRDLMFLARELVVAASPYTNFVRIGGTGADFLTYAIGASKDCTESGEGRPLPSRIDPSAQTKKYYVGGERCLRPERIDALLDFLKHLRAPAILGLNIEKRQGKRWDPRNARELVTYAATRNYHFAGLQLGNEVNLEISPSAYVADLEVLQAMLHETFPNPRMGRPFMLGPDPHSLHKGAGSRYERNILAYLSQFSAEVEARKGLSLAGVSHHEYIQAVIPNAMRRDDVGGFESGTVKKDEPNVLDPAWLDRSAAVAQAVSDAVLSKAPCEQVWLSELGPHNAGRPRCVRGGRWANFGNSLWYMDALGSKARAGYGVVCRQALLGADYSLLDCATKDPLPDYYATLLWARLMGQRVLTTRLSVVTSADDSPAEAARRRTFSLRGNPSDAKKPAGMPVRIYTHCAKGGTGITLLVINLSPDAIEVDDVALLRDAELNDAAREVTAAFLGIRQDGLLAPGYERMFVHANSTASPASLTQLLAHQAAMQEDFVAHRSVLRPTILAREVWDTAGREAGEAAGGWAGNATSEGGRRRRRRQLRHEGDGRSDVLGSVRVEYVMTNPAGDLGGMDVALNGVLLRPLREGEEYPPPERKLSTLDRLRILWNRIAGGAVKGEAKRPPLRSLPPMDGRVVNATQTKLRLPPTSYGFFHYPDAKMAVCTALSPRTPRQQRSRCVAARSDAVRATAATEAAAALVEDVPEAPPKPLGPIRFEIETDTPPDEEAAAIAD